MKNRGKRKASKRLADRVENFERSYKDANEEAKLQMHRPGSRNPRKGSAGGAGRKRK